MSDKQQSYDNLVALIENIHRQIASWDYELEDRTIKIDNKDVVIEAPTHWSDTAVRIMATKYMRKDGVPNAVDSQQSMIQGRYPTAWIAPRKPKDGAELGQETSVAQVFRRIAGHWTLEAFVQGIFQDPDTTTPEIASSREDELLWKFFKICYRLMLFQVFAPNSPQFFNTGLWWAYGIEGENGRYVNPQTSACFILGVEDNLIDEDGIFDTLSTEAHIFKYGSGSGANFSKLRPKGAPLSSGGKSSGLISFLKVLDTAAGAIKSGGTTRRAAKMVVVDADHQDAWEFARLKAVEELKIRALQSGVEAAKALDPHYSAEMDALRGDWESGAHETVGFQNANHSIRWTDEQVKSVMRGMTGEASSEADAAYYNLWQEAAKAAHACGDPGVQFHDACNRWHTIPKAAPQRATNPCSEYSFIDNSACNLASINLMAFFNPAQADVDAFDGVFYAQVCEFVTIVLDLTVSLSSYPTEKIRENSLRYRTLGLGYTNLGALLMALGFPYASPMALNTAACLTAIMHGSAWKVSNVLAKRLEPFADFSDHCNDVAAVLAQHYDALDLVEDDLDATEVEYEGFEFAHELGARLLGHAKSIYAELNVPVRNAQLTLLAPTGTISFIMDCATTGIEPDFALVKTKVLAGGGVIHQVNDVVPIALQRLGYSAESIKQAMQELKEEGEASFLARLDPEHREVFGTANTIDWRDHIRMMAAVQPFLSGAISKTVNMPEDATVDDVSDAYLMAWRSGLKALAIYRDGCKVAQPLRSDDKNAGQKGVEGATGNQIIAPAPQVGSFGRERLPDQRRGTTVTARIGGHRVYLRTGEYPDGRIGEVFLTIAKAGSHLRAYLDALAVSVSIGLQHGVPMSEYVDAFRDIKCEPSGAVTGDGDIRFCTSVLDWVARVLDTVRDPYLESIRDAPPIDPNYMFAPDNEEKGEPENLGDACPNCGHFTLQRSGTCLACRTCGWTGGCS